MEHLLSLVGPLITRQDTNYRKAIPAAERLMLTVRFFASGDPQISFTYLFRMGKKTVSRIISETSRAIHLVLKTVYFSAPKIKEQWKKISEDFEMLWQFPHVIGAIDGKHMRIQNPNKCDSLYYNYKGFFSVQLLAVCDPKCNFIFADVGQYGSNNDCAVLKNSIIGQKLANGSLKIPDAEKMTE